MHLDRRIKIQLVICAIIALVAGGIMIFGYIRLPATFFGIGRYTVTVQLPSSGGLYASGNVTYRGTEVGRVTDVHLNRSGVDAVLSLRSDVPIPSNLDAQVHSASSLGEVFIALAPRDATSAPLKNGDVIPTDRTSVAPDINSILAATNRGLQAIPHDNLKTVVDEGYTAVGGLGPDLARIERGSTALAIDARSSCWWRLTAWMTAAQKNRNSRLRCGVSPGMCRSTGWPCAHSSARWWPAVATWCGRSKEAGHAPVSYGRRDTGC